MLFGYIPEGKSGIIEECLTIELKNDFIKQIEYSKTSFDYVYLLSNEN
jgi:hypothetical protein